MHEGAAQAEIEAIYRAVAEAVAAKDVDAFLHLFDPRPDPPDDGFVTPQARAYFTWRFGRLVETHGFDLQLERFVMEGEVATVDFAEHNEATVLDRDDNRVRRAAYVRERGVWRRTPHGWVQTAYAFLEPPTVQVDGHAVTPDTDPVGMSAFLAARSQTG